MQSSFGLDFGTTNTVLSVCDEAGAASPVRFRDETDQYDAIRSALCFTKGGQGSRAIDVEIGPWAINRFIEHVGDCRFMQSIKTFAASESFGGAYVYAKKFAFEDLLSTFLRRAFEHAPDLSSRSPRRIVVGRPVKFAGAAPNEALAMSRYRQGLSSLGFDEIYFVFEPVAAAVFFAQRLAKSATVLVADFGGGTSDYSVVRFEKKGGRLSAQPLAQGGVGVGGDNFDYRIIDRIVLPEIGKGTQYRGMAKDVDLPQGWFANFARWNLLSVFKASQEFQDLKRLRNRCLESGKIDLFIELVEEDQGYPLYKAVSELKASLSGSDEAVFRFDPLGQGFSRRVRREDFESWIVPDLARLDSALTETLRTYGLNEGDIDHVFLTGGTSFVPAVRSLFSRQFDADRISSGDQLVSIAKGLALIGQRDDLKQWIVTESELDAAAVR